MSKVVKFGGSSLADANQFRKVADIIRSDKERRYVVPSAPGKRFKDDIKVTDMLYACYDAVTNEGKNTISLHLLQSVSTELLVIWVLLFRLMTNMKQ